MNYKLLTTKMLQPMRQDGFISTRQECLCNLKYESSSSNDFNRRYCTNSGGIELSWKFKIGLPNARFGASYQATQEQEFADVIDFLYGDLQTFTFIDLDWWKGRSLLLASDLGFKQVIGLGFVHEFVKIAQTNLGKMQITHTIVLDAAKAEVQFSNNDTVIYLYNSFTEEDLSKVCENLRDGCLKRLYIIYKVPQRAEIFDCSHFLTRLSPTLSRSCKSCELSI